MFRNGTSGATGAFCNSLSVAFSFVYQCIAVSTRGALFAQPVAGRMGDVRSVIQSATCGL
jgi:hypothetical protein